MSTVSLKMVVRFWEGEISRKAMDAYLDEITTDIRVGLSDWGTTQTVVPLYPVLTEEPLSDMIAAGCSIVYQGGRRVSFDESLDFFEGMEKLVELMESVKSTVQDDGNQFWYFYMAEGGCDARAWLLWDRYIREFSWDLARSR